MKKYAIVGFGCAGYHAARALREFDSTCQIDVFSNTDTAPANPMLTTYYVAGKISREEVFPFGSRGDIEKRLDIRFHENLPVIDVSPADVAVTLADGSRHIYDDIVLASGSHPLVPPIQGMPEKGIYVMRTVDDADKLLAAVEQGLGSALVIGASWVGIKVVEALHAHHVHCTLTDMAPYIFPTAALPETAERIHEHLRSLGVDLHFGHAISALRQEKDGIVSVFGDGSEIKSDIVALCMGLRPTVPYLKEGVLEMGRGVRVDRHMRSSAPHVYAAGDCCETQEMMSGQYMSVNLWANAAAQGWIAGRNITGHNDEFQGCLIHNITHFLNLDFIGLGDPRLEGDVVELASPGSDIYVKAIMKDGRLQCANILGNYRVSGSLKSWFIRQQRRPGEPMPTALRVNLMREGLSEELIGLIGGDGE